MSRATESAGSGCCDRGKLQSVEAVLDWLKNEARVTEKTERIPLADALGRVLAKPIVSSVEVPPFDNSAVDGYAVNTAAREDGPVPVALRIPAGAHPEPLPAGTAARIFTGAVIPAGADAVVMQEDCQAEGDQVHLPDAIVPGQNIRPAGQDIRKGQTILDAGRRLRPQDLGLIASVGQADVQVYQPLRVGMLSTGDELVEPGGVLTPGKIFNSNRYQLKGMLEACGFQVVDAGIVEDSFEATEAAFRRLSGESDVLITTGGVSVGEEDYVKAVVRQYGSLDLWRLAIKPGKPFAFGYFDGKPLLGLPGNPGAVFVTFSILALPFLRQMQGETPRYRASHRVPLGFSVKKPGKRREFLRVRLENGENGEVLIDYPNQSSGVLSSACWADGFAVIPEHTAPQAGERVEYVPFNEIFSLWSH